MPTKSVIPNGPFTQALLIFMPLALALHPHTDAMAENEMTIPALMAKPSLNVVLIASDIESSKEFYGKILGLEPMNCSHPREPR